MMELRAAVLGVLVQWSGCLYDPVHHIESARLYGNIDYYAYYFVDLLIGTPPQRVSVILDTGSGVAAFPCANCNHCGRHIDPNFDVAKSKTAQWMKCGKGCRGSCRQGHCSYHQGYQEGSSISGYWFQDWVRLGDAIQRNPPVFTNVGCHYNENKLFYTQKANGILGIRGSGNLLNALFKDKAHIESQIFAICLAEWGGRLVVGGHNKSYHRGQIEWTSVSPSSYGVALNSMKVEGSSRSITGFGHTMIDSGTTYTYMGSAPYRALKGDIEDYCRKHKCASKSGTKCWTVSKGPSGLSRFPPVKVQMKGATSVWEPRGYLYRKGTSNQWCYSFEDDGPRAPTVLGASWMLYKEVIFDLRVNKVGIVRAECPEYKKRPEHSTKNLEPPTAGPTAIAATTRQPTGAASPGPTSAPFQAASAFGNPETVDPAHPAERVSSAMSWLGYARAAAAVFLAFITLGVFGCCTRRMCRSPKEHAHTQLGQDDDDSGMPPQIVGSVTGDSAGPDSFIIGDGDADDNSEEGLGLVHNVEPGQQVGGAGIDPLGSPRHSVERSFPEPRRALPSGDGPLE
mmetsp:Transcript_60074/g.110380  ORF Transcript_60074/g.110380 Transcript_60074/m.110380 type:complete len:568 (+) Transcript_60074:130-1833(+)